MEVERWNNSANYEEVQEARRAKEEEQAECEQGRRALYDMQTERELLESENVLTQNQTQKHSYERTVADGGCAISRLRRSPCRR